MKEYVKPELDLELFDGVDILCGPSNEGHWDDWDWYRPGEVDE